MNTTSGPYPRGVDEMKEAGLEAAPSVLVKVPRVKASPCAMECRWLQTVRLNDVDGHLTQRYIVFGQVVGIHIDERFIKDGLSTPPPCCRLRAPAITTISSPRRTKFSLRRPKGGGADHLAGLNAAAE